MKKENFFQYIKQNYCFILLAFILFIQVVSISACNIKLIDNNIDGDNAKLFVHTIKMWEHKSIIIPNWSYMTTLEIDCSSILALPLFALTGNIYLSYGIANIIFLIAFILLIFYLFHDRNKIYPLLTSNLLCIPYTVGMLDYFNMLFFAGSQYIIKASVPLLLIAVLLKIEDKNNPPKKIYEYIPAILLAFFCFLTAVSSGVYVLFVGIFPILLVYLIYKLLKYEKIPFPAYGIMSTIVIFSLIGIMLNNKYMGGARGSGMILISVHQILSNVSSCFAGIYELFGGIAYDMDITVLSLKGIEVLLKAVLIHIVLICGIIAISRIIKNKSDLRTTLLISVFIWNMFVLLATKTQAGSATYEYRYHIIGLLPLFCVTSTILLDKWNTLKPLQKNIFATTGILIILCLNLLSFPKALDRTDKQIELKELCAYCDQLELDYVYLYDASNDADMCRLISEDDAHYLFVGSNGTTWAYDYYQSFVGGSVYPENAILIVDNRYDFGDSFESFGYRFTKFDTVANRTLYYFSE